MELNQTEDRELGLSLGVRGTFSAWRSSRSVHVYNSRSLVARQITRLIYVDRVANGRGDCETRTCMRNETSVDFDVAKLRTSCKMGFGFC